MQIQLEQLGKRYQYEWIFKNLDYTFVSGESYAILGHNGSGKSTLMQVLSAYLSASKGKIHFSQNGLAIPVGEVYQWVSYTAPYIDLIDEFTLLELLEFHQKFKPFQNQLDSSGLLAILQLSKQNYNKPLKFFSSGMKQRVKLVLAICAQTPVLLLDEPTITLDRQGVAWYQGLLQKYALGKRLFIVASNVKEDYQFCSQYLRITDYKVNFTSPC